jgi:hypothetical protein
LRWKLLAYELRLIGRFDLRSNTSESITIASRKHQALIALLALAEGRPVSRTRLAEALWPEVSEEQAGSIIRQDRRSQVGTGRRVVRLARVARVDRQACPTIAAGAWSGVQE